MPWYKCIVPDTVLDQSIVGDQLLLQQIDHKTSKEMCQAPI